MPVLVKVRSFLRNLFSSPRVEADLDQEVQGHLEMLTDENIRAGLTRTEAQRAARIELGGVDQLKEQVREQRIGAWLHSVLSDCRFGLRQLRKNPAFTAVTILTLALGIGSATSVFSLIDAVLVRSLPYPYPDRLVYLWSPNPRFPVPLQYQTPMTGDFFDLQRQNHSFASLALFDAAKFNVAADGRADALGGAHVTGDFFETMGIAPELGRVVTPIDDQPGHEQVVVISHSLWRDRFGSQTDILGKTLLLNAKPYQIIGVMPAGFLFPRATDVTAAAKVTDVWIPFAMTPEQRANRVDSAGNAIGRLRAGISFEQAQSELSTLIAAIDSLRPPTDRGFGAKLQSVFDSVTGGFRNVALLLMAAVALFLLIACGNVACLVMVRASSRIREMGVRAALGAGRVRLIRQLLTESILLAGGAGVLAVFVAFVSIRLLLRLDPGNIARLEETSIDTGVLFFAFGISMFTSLLSGLLPAVSVSRCDPSDVLMQWGGRSERGARSSFRQWVIITQIALTVVLLTASGLLIRSFAKVQSVQKGFDSLSAVTMKVSLDARYDSPERQTAFYRNLIDALSALPGVTAAGAVTNLPLGHEESLSWLTVEGHNFDEKVFFQTRSVTPHYFAAMGIRLVAGRLFAGDDAAKRPLVAIVDETFVKTYFPTHSPLGKRFHFIDGASQPTWWTIVGVVDHIRNESLEEASQPQAYLPLWQSSATAASIVLRTNTGPALIAAAARKELSVIDPALAFADIRTMGQLVSESTAARRFQTLLLSAFSGIALVLSLVGLYAILAYSVRQRTAETGIRMALGAQRSSVMRSILKQGLKLVSVGIAAGAATAWILARLMTGFLFDVKPTDGPTFFAAALLFFAVATAACLVPAYRATRVDPVVALRCE